MVKSDREILESLTMDDLQEQHREIAEAVGLEGMLNLTNAFGGNPIYIPKKRELVKNRIYRMIADEYDGTNIKELAVKYDVCESTVYNVVRDKIVRSGVKSQITGQMSFADIGI